MPADDLGNVFAKCVFDVAVALRGRHLATLDVALCENRKTCTVEFRPEGGWLDARSFDLPEPVRPETFDASLYADAAYRVLTSTRRH
jgi:hypothetical protein